MEIDIVADWYVLAACVGYGGAVWLVQMYRVVPPRDWLLERIWSLEARIDAEDWRTGGSGKSDLDKVETWVKGPWLFVPISRVQAGWRNIHGLEDEHVLELPAHVVDEQLKTARARLAGIAGDEAAGLVKRIDQALHQEPPHPVRGASALLQMVGPEAASLLERIEGVEESTAPRRNAALLQEANIFRHNRSDSNYEDLAGLLAKAVWLTVVALAIVVALSVLFDRESYFLFGAAGALISRLTRVFARRPKATDYGAEWSTLILAPAVGALAGWVGVLITTVLADPPFDVLSDHFAPLWDDATRPLGFLVAFVFGFSERLFNRLLGVAETQVGGKLPTEEAATSENSTA